MSSNEMILEIEDLTVEFSTRGGTARVLDSINLRISRGETLGIVGESGCGKSMTALAVMGLLPEPHGKIAGGAIRFQGEDLVQASAARMRQIRGDRIGMIFQEPMTSLNPVYPIGEQIAESVRLHEGVDNRQAMQRAREMLSAVRIPDAGRRLGDYPHELSGGMRQRVMIAMALACSPDILIADEPTTALDVTVQAQILDLLRGLQAETGTAILLITHNIGVIAEMADRVAVVYAGRKVEEAGVVEIIKSPLHPYTRRLINCVPHLDRDPPAKRSDLAEIPGTVPSILRPQGGCAFAERCQDAFAPCSLERPPIKDAEPSHQVACHLHAGAVLT